MILQIQLKKEASYNQLLLENQKKIKQNLKYINNIYNFLYNLNDY